MKKGFKSIRTFILLFLGVFGLVWMTCTAVDSEDSRLRPLYKNDTAKLPAHYYYNEQGKLVWEAWGEPVVIDTDRYQKGLYVDEQFSNRMTIWGMLMWSFALTILFYGFIIMSYWQVEHARGYHSRVVTWR